MNQQKNNKGFTYLESTAIKQKNPSNTMLDENVLNKAFRRSGTRFCNFAWWISFFHRLLMINKIIRPMAYVYIFDKIYALCYYVYIYKQNTE